MNNDEIIKILLQNVQKTSDDIGDIKLTLGKLLGYFETHKEADEKVQKRIGRLEKWQWFVSGGIATLITLVGIIIKLVA